MGFRFQIHCTCAYDHINLELPFCCCCRWEMGECLVRYPVKRCLVKGMSQCLQDVTFCAYTCNQECRGYFW